MGWGWKKLQCLSMTQLQRLADMMEEVGAVCIKGVCIGGWGREWRCCSAGVSQGQNNDKAQLGMYTKGLCIRGLVMLGRRCEAHTSHADTSQYTCPIPLLQVSFEDGSYVIRQGEEGRDFFVIASGEVSCTVKKNPANAEEQAKEVRRGQVCCTSHARKCTSPYVVLSSTTGKNREMSRLKPSAAVLQCDLVRPPPMRRSRPRRCGWLLPMREELGQGQEERAGQGQGLRGRERKEAASVAVHLALPQHHLGTPGTHGGSLAGAHPLPPPALCKCSFVIPPCCYPSPSTSRSSGCTRDSTLASAQLFHLAMPTLR